MKTLILILTLSYSLFAINVEDASDILEAQTSMQKAKQLALAEKKEIIMLVVIKDGCHWCEKLVKETLSSKTIQNELYDTVTLIADLHSDLAKKYKAEVTPSVYFIEAKSGKVLYEQVGYEKAGAFLISIISARDALE